MSRVVTAAQRAELAAVQQRGASVAARERTLPVHDGLATLLPVGLQRGWVIGCAGPAAGSLALTVVAGASQAGSWVGVAGLPTLGAAAAAEAGVAMGRLVQVIEPATPWDDARWGELLAAMVDGFDVLLLGPGVQRVRPATARRVAARLQARGAVAVCVDTEVFGVDVLLRAQHHVWEGLGEGHGVARSRQVEVSVEGRRMPRPRRAHLWLPALDGQVGPVTSSGPTVGRVVEPVPLRQTG